MEWIKLGVSGVLKTHIRHHSKALPPVEAPAAPNKPVAPLCRLESKQTPFLPETKVYLPQLLLPIQPLRQNLVKTKYNLTNPQWI